MECIIQYVYVLGYSLQCNCCHEIASHEIASIGLLVHASSIDYKSSYEFVSVYQRAHCSTLCKKNHEKYYFKLFILSCLIGINK